MASTKQPGKRMGPVGTHVERTDVNGFATVYTSLNKAGKAVFKKPNWGSYISRAFVKGRKTDELGGRWKRVDTLAASAVQAPPPPPAAQALELQDRKRRRRRGAVEPLQPQAHDEQAVARSVEERDTQSAGTVAADPAADPLPFRDLLDMTTDPVGFPRKLDKYLARVMGMGTLLDFAALLSELQVVKQDFIWKKGKAKGGGKAAEDGQALVAEDFACAPWMAKKIAGAEAAANAVGVMPANKNGDCLFICLFYFGFFLFRGDATNVPTLALMNFGTMAGRVMRRLYYNYILAHQDEVLRLKEWKGLKKEDGKSNGMMTMSDTLKQTVRVEAETGKKGAVKLTYEQVMAAYMSQDSYGGAMEMRILCSLTAGLRVQVLDKKGNILNVCGAETDAESVHTIRLLKSGGTGASSHFDLMKWVKGKAGRTRSGGESQQAFKPRTNRL